MKAPKGTKGRKQIKFSELCAEDIMHEDVITVQASDPLAEAERTLVDAQVGGAPVLDHQGNPIGVVSVRDLIRHRTEDAELPEDASSQVFDDYIDETEDVSLERGGSGACVADVMATTLVSVGRTTSLVDVAKRMVEAKVHRVLVVEHGRLVGIVSTIDMLTALATHPLG